VTIERLLSVDANVTIEIGDDRLSIRGDGSSVVVEVPPVSMAFQIIRELGAIKPIRERVTHFSELLSGVGLTVVIRIPSRRLLTMGREGNSWLLKFFGVRNANLHLT
jgi:hypothetical protein